MSTLVVLEQQAGKWNRVSFEAVAAAHKLGSAVEGVLLGATLDTAAAEGAKLPLDKLWLLSNDLLAEYTPDAYVDALAELIEKVKPELVVFPHTYQVRDYAPKLATRFRQALISDVVDGDSSGRLVRQLFQGRLNADVSAAGAPRFVSVQAGAFPAAAPADATAMTPVEKFAVNLDAAKIRSKPEAPFRESQRSVDLGAAELIVAVGRGIQEKDNLALVEELASALGAELAASRPICDNGWLPMERQVGSSGQTVAPKAYFAVGISGAIQHLVGMKGSKTVVAINKDESAPIFETADYGIVGDLFEVLPALTEEIRKAKS